MKITHRRAYEAWLAGREHRDSRSSAAWTNGETLFSYGTAILQRSNGRVYFNRTKYSPTTSTLQNELAGELIGTEYVTVDNVPRGTEGLRLLEVRNDSLEDYHVEASL